MTRWTQQPAQGVRFVSLKLVSQHLLTYGSETVLAGTVVPEDALVVEKLRKAGAVLIGHANLSEWACMRSSY